MERYTPFKIIRVRNIGLCQPFCAHKSGDYLLVIIGKFPVQFMQMLLFRQ